MSPPVFYKYLSPARIDVLQSLRVRFTQVSSLNDPFESFPGILVGERGWYLREFKLRIRQEMDQLGINGQRNRKLHLRLRMKDFDDFARRYSDPTWLMELSSTVRQMSDSLMGCLSLSATPTNILMWSHYADDHKGFVLGFHAGHEYFGKSVKAVNYSTTRPPLNPFEAGHDGELFYTKSVDWSYELEYRKFQTFVEPIELSNGHKFAPFVDKHKKGAVNETIALYPFPSESVACVIYGWKSSPDLRTSIAKAISDNGLSDVAIHEAIPSQTHYEMTLKPKHLWASTSRRCH